MGPVAVLFFFLPVFSLIVTLQSNARRLPHLQVPGHSTAFTNGQSGGPLTTVVSSSPPVLSLSVWAPAPLRSHFTAIRRMSICQKSFSLIHFPAPVSSTSFLIRSPVFTQYYPPLYTDYDFLTPRFPRRFFPFLQSAHSFLFPTYPSRNTPKSYLYPFTRGLVFFFLLCHRRPFPNPFSLPKMPQRCPLRLKFFLCSLYD